MIHSNTEWNPLYYIGDVHLRALMSWMRNEANYGKKWEVYVEKERNELLPLRPKGRTPYKLYLDWLRVTYGSLKLECRDNIFDIREHVYKEFLKIPYHMGQRAFSGITSQWERHPTFLRRVELHSPLNFKVAM